MSIPPAGDQQAPDQPATGSRELRASRQDHVPETVGLIGLGLLGTAIGSRLLAAGYHVQGYDIRGESRDLFAAAGGSIAHSPQEAATCRHVLLCLPDSEVVDRVLNEILPVVQPGQLIVDTSTGYPDDIERQWQLLQGRGVRHVEATVHGSSRLAAAGAVTVTAGGDAEHVAAARALLETFASRVILTGAAGSGSRCKLTVNLILGLNRAVLAEGLALGRACGLDLTQLLEILQDGPADSAVLRQKGRRMAQHDFAPEARLAQHRKDVGLIQQLAAASGARTPLTERHAELLDGLIARGLGDRDNSAIMRAFEQPFPGSPGLPDEHTAE